MSENYKYFVNDKCEFYPCHKIDDIRKFNCLFCFCPLYSLGDKCGGNFHYLDNGIKDCSLCLFPHIKDNYEEMMIRCQKVMELGKRK